MHSTKWTIYITCFLLKVRVHCRLEGEKTVGVGDSGWMQSVMFYRHNRAVSHTDTRQHAEDMCERNPGKIQVSSERNSGCKSCTFAPAEELLTTESCGWRDSQFSLRVCSMEVPETYMKATLNVPSRFYVYA